MNLTERERIILQFSKQGLSDYRIAQKTGMYPQNVTRPRKNAHKKIMEAIIDLEWIARTGISLSESNSVTPNLSISSFSFFL
jgi:transcriptional regulator